MHHKYNYIKIISTLFIFVWMTSCDDSSDLLNQHLKDGPIIYAGRVDSLHLYSGFYRVKANIFPANDVNRSYCILKWTVAGMVDSLKVDYIEDNFDQKDSCYFAFIDFPSGNMLGNVPFEAYNVDDFGNKSLTTAEGAFVYDSLYVSTLINSPVRFSSDLDEIHFGNKIGAVGNLLSYEQNTGELTQEVFVTDISYELTNAKAGGIARTKTRYIINESDIDTLNAIEYLETKMPQVP